MQLSQERLQVITIDKKDEHFDLEASSWDKMGTIGLRIPKIILA